MISFISDAMAETAAQAPAAAQGGGMSSIVMLVGFLAIFYFMMWRPQAKRAKEHRQMLSQLAPGDEIITTGGVMGRVTKVLDEIILVQIAEAVEVKLQKQAITAVLPKGTLKSV